MSSLCQWIQSGELLTLFISTTVCILTQTLLEWYLFVGMKCRCFIVFTVVEIYYNVDISLMTLAESAISDWRKYFLNWEWRVLPIPLVHSLFSSIIPITVLILLLTTIMIWFSFTLSAIKIWKVTTWQGMQALFQSTQLFIPFLNWWKHNDQIIRLFDWLRIDEDQYITLFVERNKVNNPLMIRGVWEKALSWRIIIQGYCNLGDNHMCSVMWLLFYI